MSPVVLSSHKLHKNISLSPVFVFTTSTCCKCHAAPAPLLLCPISIFTIFPTLKASTVNSSSDPLWKLSLLLERGREDVEPHSPWRVQKTSAVVDAKRMSEVETLMR